jgi:hypothetical protein
VSYGVRTQAAITYATENTDDELSSQYGTTLDTFVRTHGPAIDKLILRHLDKYEDDWNGDTLA